MVSDQDFKWIDVDDRKAAIRIDEEVYIVRGDLIADKGGVILVNHNEDSKQEETIFHVLPLMELMTMLPCEMQLLYVDIASRYALYRRAWLNVKTANGI